MTTLMVGQRVRVVGPAACRWLGQEAVIVGPLESMIVHHYTGERGAKTREMGHLLSVAGLGRVSPSGRPIAGLPEFLEPIIPEGAQPAEWSACEWQPEHMRTPS